MADENSAEERQALIEELQSLRDDLRVWRDERNPRYGEALSEFGDLLGPTYAEHNSNPGFGQARHHYEVDNGCRCSLCETIRGIFLDAPKDCWQARTLGVSACAALGRAEQSEVRFSPGWGPPLRPRRFFFPTSPELQAAEDELRCQPLSDSPFSGVLPEEEVGDFALAWEQMKAPLARKPDAPA